MEVREVAIAWIDLSFKVKQFCFSEEKVILNKLNGSVEFGTINALMGPSGAGKTTLLKCLNGKLSSGMDTESKIYVNMKQKIRPCFVGQHSKEHLVMCLTAKQNMIYASKLKNSNHRSETGAIDHEKNARDIMIELLIKDIADTRVEQCSGGEQKRLTISVEMTKIVKPNLLCIDEPTTGLDSNAAECVMNCLRNLSKAHKMSIITSIHQPNNEIVLMFDKIYVLAKGGNCVFSGSPDLIPSHLNDYNIILNENQVHIEQLLKYASIESQDQYLNELILRTRQTLRQDVLKKSQDQLILSATGLHYRSKTFSPFDVWHIMMRLTLQYIKQWKALFLQFLFYTLFAFFTSNMFSENIGKASACFNPHTLSNESCVKDLENSTSLKQNLNFLFFMTIIAHYIHLCYATMIYLNDIKIFINEHDNNWYSTGSFFCAKNVVELIPTLIFSSIFAVLTFYWSGQLLERERLLGFILLQVLGFIVTEGFGHNFGISLVYFPNIAIFVSMSLFAVMVMYSNYFILVKDLPLLFQYISDFTHPKYLFNSVLILIYGLNRCSSDEKSIIFLKFGVNDSQLFENYYKLGIYAILLRMSEYFMLYLKTNFSFNIKSMKKQIPKTDETFEMKSNDSTVVEFNNNKKRLSLILSEIQSALEDDNVRGVSDMSKKIEENTKKQMSIAWTDLTLRIPMTFFIEEKVILKQINCFFEFGTINALMGSSGAGKTSLLKCINGLYNEYITDESTILLNKFRRIRTCYVVQDVREHILTGLTAGQAMTYASKLKNSETNFDHQKNVQTLMKELLIFNTFDTSCETCSGGEQKRLVIGMELTSSKPNLLCIDEPTSGLDSNAAEVVIKCLKRLSENHNICVITSIHQPNNDSLVLFNKLYVLAKGGQPVYSGPPQELKQYLLECGFLFTKNQVPIEVLLKHSCNGINDSIVQKMVVKAQNTEKSIINNRHERETEVFIDGIKRVSKRFYIRDFLTLLMRALTHTYRYKWKLILFESLIYMIFAITVQLIYGKEIGVPTSCINFEDDFNNTCAKTEEKLAEETLIDYNIKYIYYAILVITFYSLILTTMTFTAYVKMFFNEQRNGWYSTGAYYWSISLAEIIPVIFNLVIYSYLLDIYERSMFLSFFIYLTIGALVVQSIGHFIGIVFSSNIRIAVFTSLGLFIFAFLFNNFMIPTKDLHYSLQIVSHLSPLKLLMESIFILYYGFDLCSDREFSAVLYFFDLEDRDLYKNTYLLVLQFFVFRTASMIALLYKVNPLTNSKERARNNREVIQKAHKPSKAFISGLTSEFD